MAKRNRHHTRRFTYDTSLSERIEIYDWCMDNLGKSGRKTWSATSSGRIYIKEPESIMAFKLRWL